MVKIHCVDHNERQKILKDLEISDYIPASWETCIQVKKQQWEQDTEKQMVWNWGKKTKNKKQKLLYCHPVYLTYMQSTSWKMLGWRKHKQKLREK